MASALTALSMRELGALARKRGIANWRKLTKPELIRRLKPKRAAKSSARPKKPKSPPPMPRLPELNTKDKSYLQKAAVAKKIPRALSLTKAELIRALSKTTGQKKKSTPTRSTKLATAARRTHKNDAGLALRRRLDLNSQVEETKKNVPDRIVTMVRDAYWLHVFWQISRESIHRTEAALGGDWYSAKPTLRLMDVTAEDTTSAAQSVVRDIEIHGGVNNWYINLDGLPRSYRVDVGYLTERGRFFSLGRSNIVTPPRPGTSEQGEGHWKSVRDDCERILALSRPSESQVSPQDLQEFFEERFGRPLGTGSLSNYGSGALTSLRQQFHFDVDVELVVHGRTHPEAHVMLHGKPVKLRKDGSFTLRYALPEGRQIIPATSATRDGIEERTVIIALERNTKILEPMIHDGQES